MKKTLKKISVLLGLSVLCAGFLVVGSIPSAHAQTRDDVCEGVQIATGAGCDATATQQADTAVNRTVATAVNLFSFVVGVAAVIMVMLGGFRYITAGGDSGKISSAQQTIIYALVGLVVVALAQILVRFVLNRVSPSGA
jgi:hypothetical protein